MTLPGLYILDGRTPTPCYDLDAWAEWMESPARTIALDCILCAPEPDAPVVVARISTVFLGLDLSFGHGEPLLFETIIFGTDWNLDTHRYTTWEQATAGHAAITERVIQHILGKAQPFVCPVCQRTSFHPPDAQHRYCGACHTFH